MWGGKSIHDEKEGASSLLLLSREIGNLAAFLDGRSSRELLDFVLHYTEHTKK